MKNHAMYDGTTSAAASLICLKCKAAECNDGTCQKIEDYLNKIKAAKREKIRQKREDIKK